MTTELHKSTSTGDDEVMDGLRATVSWLLPRSFEIADELARHAVEQTPAVTELDLEHLVFACCRAHMTSSLDCLAREVPLETLTLSAELVGFAKTLARSGLTLEALMRGHRAANSQFIACWADAAATCLSSTPSTAVQVVKRGTQYSLKWHEAISDLVSEHFTLEKERLAQEQSHVRLDEVRRVLAGTHGDSRAVGGFGYRLNGRHLAVVLADCSGRPDETGSLEAALREICMQLGVTERLGVRVDARLMWCWLRWPTSRPASVRDVAAPVLVAVGTPAEGADGFRSSHREALEALRTAEIARLPAGTATAYPDVAVAALCTTDLGRAGAFVETELGALTDHSPTVARVRATLQAFLAENSNYRATATRLGLHHNTIRSRIEHAERLLGRQIGERRMELELALHLAEYVSTGDGPEGRRED
ncbi:PucR family transcriptional regulator [Rhodococcoides fascians]|uniref:PucR family transcriptional regulator n=1 Tax=Rhodococcoides fascians TaxID=1828 RepID=UPI000691D4D2|nr:helix-turn-helix domain-containing protein [Rhodococcus fascians]